MDKRREKTTSRFQKILFFPFLFLVWLILQIGSIPKYIFAILILIVNYLKMVWSNLVKIKLNLPEPNHNKPASTYVEKIYKVNKVSRTKKTKPFFASFVYKIGHIFNLILPSPLRVVIIISIVLTVFFSYSIFLVNIAHDLPSPDKLNQLNSPATTEFYDRNGQLLYRLYEGENRTPVNLSDLPPNLVNATVAIEDKNFYSHPGFDIFGIARAALAYVQNRQIEGGGSTITQQLIKNTLLTPEQSLNRKVKEIFLAFWTERIFSKQDILQMYFNEVPYGGPAWGIAAASQTYFNKQPKDLTLAESAYLAGLPVSPTTYSPYGTNPELGKERQKEVLRRMVEDGYINQNQATQAENETLNIQAPVTQIEAPHFVLYLRQLLADKYGERVVSQGGLRIYTTLDLNVQHQVESIVADEVGKLAPLDVSNGAAMVTDAKTGDILAMVGSKDYFDKADGGNFNVAIANRQPGSSIKPITYATAFKQGFSPGTVLLDAPTTFKNQWETYSPVNYDGTFHGPVTIRTALGSSYNIPAVKTLALVGIPNMIQTAQDMGITTFTDPSRYGLSLTLGGGEVKLIDMMSVYGTLSQLGTKYDIQPVLKITDSKGDIIEDNTNPTGKQVLPTGVAYMIDDILADNSARTPAFGPNSLLKIPGHTVSVKTGTTDNKRDNWTFGFTPDLVVGVWVGNNDNHPMNPALTSGVTGAAPIWNRIMTTILKDRPDVAFAKPADVTIGTVDGHKDLVLYGQAPKSVVGQAPQPKNPTSNATPPTITLTDPFSTYTAPTDQSTQQQQSSNH